MLTDEARVVEQGICLLDAQRHRREARVVVVTSLSSHLGSFGPPLTLLAVRLAPITVNDMDRHQSVPSLGDIITFPDGRSFSVRMFTHLPENDLRIASLCLLGDLEMLLAPSTTGLVADVLLPVETLPPGAATARALCDGAASFWAPHLPAIGGAMGEVLFRLMLLRSAFAPLVVIDRGGDHVFFMKVGEVGLLELRSLRMPKSTLDAVEVSRFAAVVDPAPALMPEKTRPLPQRR